MDKGRIFKLAAKVARRAVDYDEGDESTETRAELIRQRNRAGEDLRKIALAIREIAEDP